MKLVIFSNLIFIYFIAKSRQEQIIIEELNHGDRGLGIEEKRDKFVAKVSGTSNLKKEDKEKAEEYETKNSVMMSKLDNKFTGPITKVVGAAHDLHSLLRYAYNTPFRAVKKVVKNHRKNHNIKYIKVCLKGFSELEKLMNTVMDFQKNLSEILQEKKADINIKFTPLIESLEEIKAQLKEKIEQKILLNHQ